MVSLHDLDTTLAQPSPAERFPNTIRGQILSPDVEIGVGVVMEPGAVIKADRVRIGDFVYLGAGVKAFVPQLVIGDYTRINEGSFLGGTKPMTIGRNCYFGKSVQLDSRGGLTIGDNVGAGSLTQIWTHIRFGDPVQGCRWDKEYPLVIEDDVWLVARVTVGGCERIEARAMVLNESNVTRKVLLADRTYAGNPVMDVTERLGGQFEDLTLAQKWERLAQEIARFEAAHPQHAGQLRACLTAGGFVPGVTCFEVQTRTYTKRYHPAEVAFLRWTLAKFVPAAG